MFHFLQIKKNSQQGDHKCASGGGVSGVWSKTIKSPFFWDPSLIGYNVPDPKHPGNAKFTYNTMCGDILHYHCFKKKSYGCNAKAKVIKVDSNGNDIEHEVIDVDNHSVHNHYCNGGAMLAEKIKHEMKVNFLQ